MIKIFRCTRTLQFKIRETTVLERTETGQLHNEGNAEKTVRRIPRFTLGILGVEWKPPD
jgi:hypothetical protein